MARGIFLIKFPHPYNSGHGALRDAFSCCKHSLNGDSISLLGAVQQHMGHSAYQLSVLQDWASTHPLDNSSGSGNQIRVLNGNYHISPIGASGRHADNFNIKFLHGVPLHIASYDRRSCLSSANGDRVPKHRAVVIGLQDAENSVAGVRVEITQIAGQIKIASQLPSSAAFSLFDSFDR